MKNLWWILGVLLALGATAPQVEKGARRVHKTRELRMAQTGHTIEIPALGRPFQLGMLYDCRKDALIPSISLWDCRALQKDVTIKPQPKTESEIIVSDTIDDKASALDISASLKASFMGGLVEVGGSAKYLHDTKKSKKQARVTVQYKTTTRYEQLTMSHLGIQNVCYPEVFEQGTATHVVTAILYGAQAFFVFDREVSSTETVQDIQGSLQLTIKKLISVPGVAEVKLKDGEKENALKFSCKFHGDFSLEKNPVTFQDAIQVYETLPKLLGRDGEKAVPMRVWLYPLTKLDTRAAKVVREISLKFIFDAEKILEELNEIEMQSNDLAKDPICDAFPDIMRKIQRFKDLCRQHRQTFQKQLASVLPSIRGGEQEEGTLEDILMSVNQSPFNSQKLRKFLDTKKREMNFVKSYLTILSEMQIVPSQNKLEEIVLDPQNAYVVSFIFTSLHEEEPFLLSLQDWLQEPFLQEPAKSTRSTPGVKKGMAWFQDKERTRNARQAARSIKDFFSVNRSNEKVRFVVASLPDVDTPVASIYLYEDGKLVSKNFELPSKPHPLQITELRHDSIQLKFQPAEYGRAAISSYLVEFKIAGEDNWKTVRTEDARLRFLLKDLRPNAEYQFQYAACCKLGCSNASDLSPPVKTLPVSPPEKLSKFTAGSSAISVPWMSPSIVASGAVVKQYKVKYRMVEDEKEDAGNIAYRFIQKSSLVKDSSPLVYALPLKQCQPNSYTSSLFYSLGEMNSDAPKKEILLIGATPSETKTLINRMINYILGVRWEHYFRYKFLHETPPRSKAGSAEWGVTVYTVYHQKGFRIPYSLTITDTGEFGSVTMEEKQVKRHLQEFVSFVNHRDRFSAIFLVARALLTHSVQTNQFIFDSILSMRGKVIPHNVQLLVTFADEGISPVLVPVKDDELLGDRDELGIPLHFRFNHSALFAHQDNEGSRNATAKISWKMSAKSMKDFFDSLMILEEKTLKV